MSAPPPALTHQPLPELHLLTALRGIAAWWVVFYHMRPAMPWLWPSVQIGLSYGYLAVDFFFLLSGFVIWISAERDFHLAGWGAARGFWWRRIARIAPLYWLVLAATVVLAVVLELSGRSVQQDYPFRELPLHVAMIQNWGFTDRLTWNHPAWSISTEMAAYLVFPLWLMVAKPARWATPLVLVAIIGLAFLLGYLYAAHSYATLGVGITQLGLWRCLILFAIGTLIAILWQRQTQRVQPYGVAAGLILLALLLGLAWPEASFPQPLIVPLVFAGLLLGAAKMAQDRPEWTPRWLHWLGDISYATYIAHFIGWRAFKLIAVDDATNASPWAVILFVVLLLGISALLYRFWERPAQRWLRRFAGC